MEYKEGDTIAVKQKGDEDYSIILIDSIDKGTVYYTYIKDGNSEYDTGKSYHSYTPWFDSEEIIVINEVTKDLFL